MDENTKLEKSLAKTTNLTSLKDLVRVKQSENVFLLIDTSGSMATNLLVGGRRIDALRTVVKKAREERPVRLVSFGAGLPSQTGNPGYRDVGFVDDPPEPGGGTPLDRALDFARENGAGRCVVISDGWPDHRGSALDAAVKFGGQVDVIFVGDLHTSEGMAGSGFLQELAARTGGQRFEGDLSAIRELTGMVVGLLNGEVLEEVTNLGSGDDEDEEDDEDDFDVEEDDDDEDEA